MPRFRVSYRATARIPTASMADIAFLLLIFFLTSTIFRLESGLEVDLPRAESGLASSRQRSAHVWIDATGRIAIDDYLVEIDEVDEVLAEKLRKNGELIVSLQIDRGVPYGAVDRLMRQLKQASIRNVNFGTERDTRKP
jgi:biopolymer transport protein ExbD